MGDATAPPPLPRHAPRSVARLRAAIRDEDGFEFFDDPMVGARHRAFARAVADRLEGLGVARPVAVEACRLVEGKSLDRATLDAFAWRVAGNLARMKAGIAPGPSPVPPRPEWAPLVVLSALPKATRHGKPGADFMLRAVAGTCCPALINKFWTRPVYAFVARDLGFTPRWGKRPLKSPLQLVGLEFFGLVDPALSFEGRPDFKVVAASGSQVTRNREILALRFREGKNACHLGYNAGAFVPCHRCAMGYRGVHGEDACRAACHPTQYESGACEACGRDDAPFDLSVSRAVCIECLVKSRMTPEKSR